MNRRDALSSVGIILGGTIVGSQAFLSGCVEQQSVNGIPFSQKQIDFLDNVGEVILPKSEKTPGAKEVKVGSFMNSIVRDFYTKSEQTEFLKSFDSIDEMSKDKFGKEFSGLGKEEKETVLMSLEEEAGKSLKTKGKDTSHYYIMIKQLVIWGYLSSEAVAFSGFNHVLLTNHENYDGCVEFGPEDRPMFGNAGRGQAYNYATHHMSRKS